MKYKLNYYAIIIIVLISGCSSINKYAKYNYFNGTTYYNDSLKIRGTFFGDIKFDNETTSDIPKGFSKKNLLVSGRAYIAPTYKIWLFYQEKKENQEKVDTLYKKTSDDKNQIVIFTKQKNNKILTLYLKSTEKHSSNKSMITDAKNMIKSFQFSISKKEKLDYFKVFNTYKDVENILHVTHKFDTAPIEEEGNQWMKTQLLLTILSKDSEHARYQQMVNNFEVKRESYLKDIIKKVKRTNKLKNKKETEILEKLKALTKDEQVVMLNENHWYPKHRIFATKLLKPLRENGFKYLAVEAINEGKELGVQKRKFPTVNTGFYIREQFFAHFIREAIKQGFTILSYDNFETVNREKTQAENLKKIVNKYPDGKVFVYAGIDHILEKDQKKKRMAEYFSELTNINPFTIDQVELVGDCYDKIELFNAKDFNNIKNINNNVDCFIVNSYKENLSELGEKEFEYTIHLKDKKDVEVKELLVALYNYNEYNKYKSSTIPIVNRVKKVRDNRVKIKAPQGTYYIKIMDVNNKTILSDKLVI